MSRLLARNLALLLSLATGVAAPAAAAREDGPHPPGLAPPEAAPAPAPAAEAPAGPPARLILGLGWDLGGDRLVEATLSDGTHPAIRANGGFHLSAGAELLPALQGRLRTRATLGVKYDAINATNARLSYLAFPLEVAEVWAAGPVRLGAGLSLSLGPRLSGSGDAAAVGADFDPSLGGLLLAEWRWQVGRPGSGLSAGVRLLWQRLRVKETGDVVGASSFGLQLGWIP